MVKYFFKSKVTNDRWMECPESAVMRMASNGFEVKKVVFDEKKAAEAKAKRPPRIRRPIRRGNPIKFYRMDEA